MRPAHLLTFVLAATAAVAPAQAAPAPADDRVAQLYDVGDLVKKLAPPERPDAADFGLPPMKPPADNAVGGEAIARLLRAFVTPKLRSGEEIKPVGDRWIVALGRPQQQAWIGRFLAAARASEAAPVFMECRCLTVPEISFLREIRPALVDGTDDDAAEVTYLTRVLAPGKATTSFVAELLEREGVTTVVDQKVLVQPLHVAHMATINQTAYVRDYEVEVTADAVIADPIVDVIQDGIVVQAAVSPLENGKLGVSLDATVTDLERPIPKIDTILPGTKHEVTIQLPSLQSTQLEAAVELEADHIVIMAPPPLRGRRIVFLITVRPQ